MVEPMTVEFIDMEWDANPRSGSKISTRDELLTLLAELRVLDPFFFELKGENGFMLYVGIGEKACAVQFGPSDGAPPFLMAVAPGKPHIPPNDGKSTYSAAARADARCRLVSPQFMCGGTATPVPTRYCLPFETMQGVVLDFLESGARSPDVLWEEI